MKKTILISLIIIIGLWQRGFSQESFQFSNPESILSFNNRYFVSNIGVKLDAEEDGDGFIAEINSEGDIINQQFLPKSGKLNAPKGMAIIKNILYVTDIDRIVGFDLKTRETIFELDISSQAKFLNDLVVVDEKTLYITETLEIRFLKLTFQKGK